MSTNPPIAASATPEASARDVMAEGVTVWRMAGGDGSRRGVFPRDLPQSASAKPWFQAEGGIRAAVVFNARGMGYVADMAGVVHGVSPDGERVWRTEIGAGISATPALSADDAALFVGAHDGTVCALDAASGGVLWKRRISSRSDPRILSDFLFLPRSRRVVFSSWSGRFHALDADSGETRGSWDAGISPRAAAAADGRENVYFPRAVAGKGVEVVRVAGDGSGEDVLHTAAEDSRGARRTLVAAAPIVDEAAGVARMVINRETGAALLTLALHERGDRKPGTLVGRRNLPASAQGTPCMFGSLVVIADLAGRLLGCGADAIQFTVDTGSDYFLSGPAATAGAAGRVYVGDPLGRALACDSNGNLTTLFEAGRSIQAQPSFDPEGRLHFPCTDRSVYRIT